MIAGVENIFDQNDLEGFVYVLRAVSEHIPPWLKFILTKERRESNFSKVDRIGKLLNCKVVEVESDLM